MAEGQVIYNRADGSEVVLPKLSPTDFLALGRVLKTQQKACLRENLAGCTPLERAKALTDFDAVRVRQGDVVLYLNSLDGQFAALHIALQKLKPDASAADVAELGIPVDDWLSVVAELAGLELEKAKRPLAGSVEPTATGSSTPTSSAETSIQSPIQ